MALQTAAPACPDDSGNTYVSCGNGTVTDNRTGLVWLANANCTSSCSLSEQTCSADTPCPAGQTCDLRPVKWYAAMEFVAGLKDIPADSAGASDDCGLSDGSSPGEWRLPAVDEWEEMVALAVQLGCTTTGDPPAITNDSGGGCWTSGPSSFSGLVADAYWSSTGVANQTSWAFDMDLRQGIVLTGAKVTNERYVWPVRGGQ